jgi:NAD(P)H dehydrogenase (quinone)
MAGPAVNVLIVFAHPEPRSFNGALLGVARQAFAAQGAEVQVSDLHAMGFNPVPSADDIKAEIAKITWCDLMIPQFPLYWFSVPAIRKGWVDQVVVPGFAFGGGAWYERGGLVGKRAMITTTNAIPYADPASRASILESYGRRLAGLAEEAPLSFHRREDFDSRWTLKSGVEPRTVGHHFATVPPDRLARLRG